MYRERIYLTIGQSSNDLNAAGDYRTSPAASLAWRFEEERTRLWRTESRSVVVHSEESGTVYTYTPSQAGVTEIGPEGVLLEAGARSAADEEPRADGVLRETRRFSDS